MRTATCSRCGTAHLSRQFRPSGGYVLVNYKTGAEHLCTAEAPRAVESVTVENRPTVPVDVTDDTMPPNSHHLLPTLVKMLRAGVHTMLVGPAGSGKTYAARQAAEVIGRPFFDRPMGPTVTEIDLLGFMTANGTFSPGFLAAPYADGGIALLDEMDASHPAGLLAVNQIAANSRASFPNGETKVRHDNFVLIGSANTYGHGADRQYVGRAELDSATLDRFAVLNWDYDQSAEIRWSNNVEWARTVQRARKAAFDAKLRVVISPRASINGAKLLAQGIPQSAVMEMVVYKGMDTDQRAIVSAAL